MQSRPRLKRRSSTIFLDVNYDLLNSSLKDKNDYFIKINNYSLKRQLFDSNYRNKSLLRGSFNPHLLQTNKLFLFNFNPKRRHLRTINVLRQRLYHLLYLVFQISSV
jgi:hypothetical protein